MKKVFFILISAIVLFFVIVLAIIIGNAASYAAKDNEMAERREMAMKIECMGLWKGIALKAITDYGSEDSPADSVFVGAQIVSGLIKERPGCKSGKWLVFVPDDWEGIKKLPVEKISKIPLFFCKHHANIFYFDGSASGFNNSDLAYKAAKENLSTVKFHEVE